MASAVGLRRRMRRGPASATAAAAAAAAATVPERSGRCGQPNAVLVRDRFPVHPEVLFGDTSRPAARAPLRVVKIRDITVVTGALLLFGAAALAVLGSSSTPELGPGPGPGPQAPATAAAPDAAALAPAATTTDGFVPPISVAEASAARPLDPNRTSGVIAGRISLAAELATRLRSVTVQVVEAIGEVPHAAPGKVPFTKNHPVEIVPEAGTPSFWIEDVPFSDHGYLVRAFAPACNGTQQVVQITAAHPEATNVHLSVLSGVPFTVLVRDQLRNAVADVPVAMIPFGEPPGRTIYRANTDNFGSVVFANVLQGQYRLLAGWEQQPLGEPKTVQVFPNTNGTEQLLVPRGQTVTIRIYGPGGYALKDADVRVQATDSVVFREYKKQTDYGGTCVLQHMPPGQYQLDVEAPGYGRRTRMFTVGDDANPAPIELQLAPN